MEQRIFDSLLLTAYLTGFTEFTPLDKSKKRSFYGNSVSHRVNVTYNYEKNCKKMIIFFKSGILRKNSFFEGSFSNYLADSQFWIPASAGMTAVEYRIRESTHKSAFISVHLRLRSPCNGDFAIYYPFDSAQDKFTIYPVRWRLRLSHGVNY